MLLTLVTAFMASASAADPLASATTPPSIATLADIKKQTAVFKDEGDYDPCPVAPKKCGTSRSV